MTLRDVKMQPYSKMHRAILSMALNKSIAMEEDSQRAHTWHLEYFKKIQFCRWNFSFKSWHEQYQSFYYCKFEASCNQNTESANGVLWRISGNLNKIMIHFFVDSTKNCLNREMQNPISLNSHISDAWVEDLRVQSCPRFSYFYPLHYTANCISRTFYFSQTLPHIPTSAQSILPYHQHPTSGFMGIIN